VRCDFKKSHFFLYTPFVYQTEQVEVKFKNNIVTKKTNKTNQQNKGTQ